MKRSALITAGLMALLPLALQGQGKYMTDEGFISFYSHTPVEDITAENHEVAGVIDAGIGEVVIIVRMKAFQFEKKLMQEHFNENYVESEKFPKATFSGKIRGNSRVSYSEPGTYSVHVEGDMTIHGITRSIKAEGTIEVGSGEIVARTQFMLNPESYNIEIPRVVRKNIADQIEISVNLPCKPI